MSPVTHRPWWHTTLLTAVVALWSQMPTQSQSALPQIVLDAPPGASDISLHLSHPLAEGQFLEQSCDLHHWSLLGIPTSHPFTLPKTRQPRYFRTGSGPSSSSGTFFNVLRTLQLAMEESPDHLPRRAHDLVRRGSALALYHFVRDEIANLPPAPFGFPDTETLTAMRWGTQATLRCGAGTPREKCQLLLELLQEAGIEARLMQATPDPLSVDLKALVEWRPHRPLDLCVDLDVLATGLDAPLPDPINLDEAEANPAHILDQVSPLLNLEGKGTAFDWSLPAAIPYVEALVNEEWTALSPLVPLGRAGKSYTTGEGNALRSSARLPRVTLTVQAAPASAPHQMLTLVRKSWSADQVAGRQVTLSFPPLGDFLEVIQSEIRELQVFTPLLTVTGSDLDGNQARALSAAGTPFSLSGELYQIDEAAGTVRLGDSDLGDPRAPPELIEQVTAIQINALDATRFPLVRLSAEATGSDGQSINGLGAGAFRLLEEDAEQTLTLQRNLRRDPSMVILLDSSGSVSEAAREENRTLATAVASEFLQHYADLNARVRVAAVSTRATFAGSWFSDPAALPEQLLKAESLAFGSDLWKAVGDLLKEERPTVVLFVTDGQATDTLTPDLRRHLQTPGVPVFTLGFGEINENTLQQISAFTGGLFHVGSPVPTIAHSLRELVDREVETNYILHYVATEAGPANRSVQLAFDRDRLQDSGSYEVPMEETRPPVSGLAGLYLTIDIDGREVSRTLAGWSEALLQIIGSTEVPTEQDLLEVHGMLFGSVTMAFEGGPPRLAVWYHEWISQQLGFEPLFQAIQSGSGDAAVQALRQGPSVTPLECYLLNAFTMEAPLDSPHRSLRTFETGLRLASYIEKPALEGAPAPKRQTDLFSLSRWVTASADPSLAYRETLERTARLNLLEQALMDQTALTALDGKTLVHHEGPVASSFYGPPLGRDWATATRPFRGYDLALPEEAGPVAFWAVDPETGTLMGVLQGGIGGGQSETDAYFNGVETGLDLAGKIASLFKFSSVGAWIELEKTKAQLMAGVIKFLNTGIGTPSSILSPLGDYACGQVRDALAGNFPVASMRGLIENYRSARGDLDIAARIGGFNNILPDIPLPGCH